MKNIITKTMGTVAVAALASTVLGLAPASAAEPAPVSKGTFTEIGSPINGETVTMDSYVLFAGGTESSGTELWKYANGFASQVKDINVGASGSSPFRMARSGDTAFFVAGTAATGNELFKSQGTSGTTTLVKDIVPGTSGSSIGGITSLPGGKVLFSATTPANGSELWISDGTEAGTELLKDIKPGAPGAGPAGFVTSDGGNVFFAAEDGTNGRELWKSNGTADGTVMVKNVNGANGLAPSQITYTDDRIFFQGSDGDGNEAWVSDGSAAGTVQLKDTLPGSGNGSPKGFTTTASGLTFFSSRGPTGGTELWKSDGTPAGTGFVKDIRPGIADSNPSDFTSIGVRIVFNAETDADGNELWSSDGTEAGTKRVKDIRPGASGSSPEKFLRNAASGATLFSANDGASGHELWVTNGEDAGTARVADLEPGAAPSAPVMLGQLGTVTVFSTSFPGGGKLWAMQTSGLSVVGSSAPTISGERKVGKTLKAKVGTWESGAKLSYQWLRNGAPIQNATSSSYLLSKYNNGKQVSVRVTGSKDGKVTGVRVSAATKINAGVQSKRPTPKIEGTAKVGKTLKIKKRTYDSGVSKTYQWLRDGKEISGSSAEKSSYKVRSSDRGHRLSVKVTAKKSGYETFTRTSSKTSKVS